VGRHPSIADNLWPELGTLWLDQIKEEESIMGQVILMIYFGGWGIATLYEEVMFFVEEGFVVFILFSWIVPMVRALLWPLNVYQALVG
jgi:hypothetical protein